MLCQDEPLRLWGQKAGSGRYEDALWEHKIFTLSGDGPGGDEACGLRSDSGCYVDVW